IWLRILRRDPFPAVREPLRQLFIGDCLTGGDLVSCHNLPYSGDIPTRTACYLNDLNVTSTLQNQRQDLAIFSHRVFLSYSDRHPMCRTYTKKTIKSLPVPGMRNPVTNSVDKAYHQTLRSNP